MSTDEILCVKCRAPACDHVLTELGRLRVALEATKVVLEAAREATCDTHTIPACVRLGKALREYDERRGAICAQCDGAGTIDGADDEPGEGPTCDRCSGRGLIEPHTAAAS